MVSDYRRAACCIHNLTQNSRSLAIYLFQAGAVVLLLNAAFLATILLVNGIVDHERIKTRAAEAVERGQLTRVEYPPLLTTQADQWTDCIGISMNLSGPPDRSPLQMLRDSDVVAQDEASCPPLIDLLTGNTSVESGPYHRYWHGYQIVSKPFLAYSNIQRLRYVAAAFATASIFVFSLITFNALMGQSGMWHGLWFATGYLLLTDGANLAGSFTHAISLFSIFSVPVLLKGALSRAHQKQLLPLAAVAGSVLAFVDLQFNPPLGLMTLLLATFSFRAPTQSAADAARCLAVITVGWSIGFFGTYGLRFLLAIALAPDPLAVFDDIAGRAAKHLFGLQDDAGYSPMAANVSNYRIVLKSTTFYVFVAFTAAFALAVVRHRTPRSHSLPWVFALPAIVPVFWFEALHHHSQVHYWFTYRSAAFSILCVAAMVLMAGRPRRLIDSG